MRRHGQTNIIAAGLKPGLHVSADALFAAVRERFQQIGDPAPGMPDVSLADALMSGFAVYSLKDPSLLAFEEHWRRDAGNLHTIYGIGQVLCDTQLRSRLDPLDPDELRPAFKAVFNAVQRAKGLEEMVFLDGRYLLALDGTSYFKSSRLSSPACLEKTSSKTGKTTHHLQALAAVIVKPGVKTVIPLPPELICKQDGQVKNDCERNAAKRFLAKFRKDHPHLKVIVVEDGLASNGPRIRDLKAHDCRFILGAKEGDHAYLYKHLNEAAAAGRALEFTIDGEDSKGRPARHVFRCLNGISLNESNIDLLVNVLEYWEHSGGKTLHFCWVTDLLITRENACLLMRGGRARWKVENETFNTLKNQGYHFEHNYGLGKKNLRMVFVSLMFLAFLTDQAQQLCCPLFDAVRRNHRCRLSLWESVRSLFHFLPVPSMEILYRALLLNRPLAPVAALTPGLS